MTTAILPAKSIRFISAAGMGFEPIKYKKDNGVYVVEREAVFRSGTFRDSWGDQMTWEDIHMKQMVENFDYLRNKGVFANVPVRDGHPGFLIHGIEGNGRTVGWHTGVTVEKVKSPIDGIEYDYLFVSYEITEPDAAEKHARGTWRNRSSEIMRYVTNDEAEFFPVYGGFAFVDIPAVEGLNFGRDSRSASDGTDRIRYFVMSDKEINVTSPAPGNPAPQTQPSPASGQPAPAAPPAQPAQPAAPHMFTINGQATSDYAAVQRHIATLEGAATEARNVARADFVNGLVQANIIMGGEQNVTSMTAFAQSLSDEQFDQWKAGFQVMPRSAVLGQHAAPSANYQGFNGAPQVVQTTLGMIPADQVEVAKGIVKAHRTNNMPLEKLKATASYRTLVAAGIEQA